MLIILVKYRDEEANALLGGVSCDVEVSVQGLDVSIEAGAGHQAPSPLLGHLGHALLLLQTTRHLQRCKCLLKILPQCLKC